MFDIPAEIFTIYEFIFVDKALVKFNKDLWEPTAVWYSATKYAILSSFCIGYKQHLINNYKQL